MTSACESLRQTVVMAATLGRDWLRAWLMTVVPWCPVSYADTADPLVRMNPGIARLKPYAFTQLRAKQEALFARGVPLIDLGVGDPADETPAFVREALVAA